MPNGKIVVLGILMMGMIACVGPKKAAHPTLAPPSGSKPSAMAAMKEGNRLFALEQFGASKSQYEAAIQDQPNLAEAHYNLGLTLDRLGEKGQAHAHYIEAANLAPGHKIIWNSPVLRRYGDIPETTSPSSSATPVLPALGGIGGLGSGGGSTGGPGY